MKVLFDTNVILDVLLKREPHYNHSVKVMALAEEGKIEGWLCASTVTTIYYLIAKAYSGKKADQHIKNLLKIFEIAVINRAVLESAIEEGFRDYEDSALHQSALHARTDAIVTRNTRDFRNSNIPVFEPGGFLKSLKSLE